MLCPVVVWGVVGGTGEEGIAVEIQIHYVEDRIRETGGSDARI